MPSRHRTLSSKVYQDKSSFRNKMPWTGNHLAAAPAVDLVAVGATYGRTIEFFSLKDVHINFESLQISTRERSWVSLWYMISYRENEKHHHNFFQFFYQSSKMCNLLHFRHKRKCFIDWVFYISFTSLLNHKSTNLIVEWKRYHK